MALIQGQLVSCRIADLLAAVSAKPSRACSVADSGSRRPVREKARFRILINLITRLWTKNNKKPTISSGFLHFFGAARTRIK